MSIGEVIMFCAVNQSTVNDMHQKDVCGTGAKLVDSPLVGSTTYFLNKSCSKWVCVGLSPNCLFETVVEVVGMKKQKLTFVEEEWILFISGTRQFEKYVGDNVLIPSFTLHGVRISSECVEGMTNILKMQKEGDVLYLSYAGMEELWNLEELIRARLKYLASLNYRKYFREIAEYIGKKEERLNVTEINMELDILLNGQVSEHACILKEVMLYNPEVLMSYAELLKNIRACVENK